MVFNSLAFGALASIPGIALGYCWHRSWGWANRWKESVVLGVSTILLSQMLDASLAVAVLIAAFGSIFGAYRIDLRAAVMRVLRRGVSD